MPKQSAAVENRIRLLLEALGIDAKSFHTFLEWALCEHLVSLLAHSPELPQDSFNKPDAMKRFRTFLFERTRRPWSVEDLNALFDRVKIERETHYRPPIAYEEYLKLLWQAPLECARCQRHPPEVILHVDHIVPASRGGQSRRANLQFLCQEHNLRKSNAREEGPPWLNLR